MKRNPKKSRINNEKIKYVPCNEDNCDSMIRSGRRINLKNKKEHETSCGPRFLSNY